MTPAAKLFKGKVTIFEVEAATEQEAADKMIHDLRHTGGVLYVAEDDESLDDLLHGYAFAGADGIQSTVPDLREEVAHLRAELMDAVRVVERFSRAVADPERVGDHDPIPSALVSAEIASARWRALIDGEAKA